MIGAEETYAQFDAWQDQETGLTKKNKPWKRGTQERQLAKLLSTSLGVRRAELAARSLIRHFGSLPAVLHASPYRLRRFDGIGQRSIDTFQLVRSIAEMMAAERIPNTAPVLSSWQQLTEYFYVKMAYLSVEHFRILFLDKKNRLIADEVQQTGTVDHTPVYPREVIKRALELSATALILVHNHPSGDPSPSQADVRMTREIAEIARPLGIVLHDHVIVGKMGHASLKSLRLI